MTYIVVGDVPHEAEDCILGSAATLAKAQTIGMAAHAENNYTDIRILHAKRGTLSEVARIVMQDAEMDDPVGWLATEQARLETEYHQFTERMKSMGSMWYGHASWPEASLPQESVWAMEEM